MDKIKGVIYTIISSLCFGIMPILAKVAYNNGLNTETLLFLRFVFASILLFVYVKIKNINMKLEFKTILYIFLICLFGYSSSSIFLFRSYNHISIGMASIILYTYPVIVLILSFFIGRKNIKLSSIVALLLSITGVYILLGEVSLTFNMKGIFLSFGSAIFFAIYVIGTSSKRLESINSFVMTLILSLSSTIIMGVYGVTTNKIIFNLNIYSLLSIVLLSIISTVIALITFTEGVKLIGPINASILSNMEPLVGISLGVILLGESLNSSLILGSLLVLSSSVIITRYSQKK